MARSLQSVIESGGEGVASMGPKSLVLAFVTKLDEVLKSKSPFFWAEAAALCCTAYANLTEFKEARLLISLVLVQRQPPERVDAYIATIAQIKSLPPAMQIKVNEARRAAGSQVRAEWGRLAEAVREIYDTPAQSASAFIMPAVGPPVLPTEVHSTATLSDTITITGNGSRILIIAPSESGKSHMMKEFLYHHSMRSTFNLVLFGPFEPSKLSKDYPYVWPANVLMWDEDQLSKVVTMQEKRFNEGMTTPLVIVVDDALACGTRSSKMLKYLFSAGRHLSITIIVISQKANDDITPVFKTNATHIIAKTDPSTDDILAKTFYGGKKDEFVEYIKRATEPFGVFLVRVKAGKRSPFNMLVGTQLNPDYDSFRIIPIGHISMQSSRGLVLSSITTEQVRVAMGFLNDQIRVAYGTGNLAAIYTGVWLPRGSNEMQRYIEGVGGSVVYPTSRAGVMDSSTVTVIMDVNEMTDEEYFANLRHYREFDRPVMVLSGAEVLNMVDRVCAIDENPWFLTIGSVGMSKALVWVCLSMPVIEGVSAAPFFTNLGSKDITITSDASYDEL